MRAMKMHCTFSDRSFRLSMLCLLVLSASITSCLGANYLSADGCSWNNYASSANADAVDSLTAAVFPPQDSASTPVAPMWSDGTVVLAISCCTISGLGCNRQDGRFGTWDEAQAFCNGLGKRLCLPFELDGCCKSGYNFDFQRVWTHVAEEVKDAVSSNAPQRVADGCPTSQASNVDLTATGVSLATLSTPSDVVPKDSQMAGPLLLQEIVSGSADVPITCCGLDGTSCVRTGLWGSFEQAGELCARVNARLCSMFEVHQCCGQPGTATSSNWDYQFTWTSSENFAAPVYNGPQYLTMDGCESNQADGVSTANHGMGDISLRQNVPVSPLDLNLPVGLAPEWRFETEIFAVQCCTDADLSCERLDVWGTWDEAQAACNAVGRRLCNVVESPRCCGTGNRFDFQRVWTRLSRVNTRLSVDGCDWNNGNAAATRNGVSVPSVDRGSVLLPSWEEVSTVLAVHCCGGPPEDFCTRENVADAAEGMWGTWAEAKAQCEGLGRRLCNSTEATTLCCKTGHNFDFQRVWTSEDPPSVANTADPNSCSEAEKATCGEYASCSKTDGNVTCTCWLGFVETNDGCEDVNECSDEAKSKMCAQLAYCVNTPGSFMCVCPEGFLGDGLSCSSDSWSVRMVFQCEDASNLHKLNMQLYYSQGVMRASLNETDDIVETAKVEVYDYPNQITANALFYTKEDAQAQVDAIKADDALTWDALVLGGCLVTEVVDGPEVYRFKGQSTSDPIEIRPSGMEVDSVVFQPDCLKSGCWVVDLTYTIGTDDFNAFFLPRAEASDQLSYDPDYSTVNSEWSQSPQDTFQSITHPCTTADLDTSLNLRSQATACCLKQFLAMYRPVASFEGAVPNLDTCTTGPRDRTIDKSLVPELAVGALPGDDGAPEGVYVKGVFSGMNSSYGMTAGVVDPFVGIYKARFYLDEVELRTMAGMLRGTVGVEHTVDTFIGILNLSPTGTYVLDTFATQTRIHLEKTSFFSVSTHGVNEYTFLEYVNMRLVMILKQDADFSGDQDTNGFGDSESANRTIRTERAGNAAYVQVTFTMGPQYQPNMDSGGLIPLDSVRAGMGTFFNDVETDGEMVHLCSIYDAANATLEEDIGLTYDGYSGSKATYDALVSQTCGPQASMCASPTSVPDQFVSFNIPLGFEVFDDQASNDLSNNIFVHFVVNAIDTVERGKAKNPNAGDAPWQMKTTLFASIPIVDGGINIFCDGITAKTDLKDVADVDIVVGSAMNTGELTRLRIMQDIASTDLATVASQRIDTDSIESALMTLVIKGNESYFSPTGRNAGDYTMELDDVITLHLMEDGEATAATRGDGSKEGTVLSLLAQPGDDNSDAKGLDTDGYALNGAFLFTIDRDAGVAHLEPSRALLAECPFNPPRPTGSNSVESCILRRDVRDRSYPARTGAQPTAMEILSCARIASGELDSTPAKDCTETLVSDAALALQDASAESSFLTRVLGASDYTRDLAPDFVRAINTRYKLNGRFRRAYWINPGYEWTPTQTAGKSLFQVSQKIYLFALISLDENWSRRRMLLQTSTDPLADNSAGMNQASFAFEVTPARMMANAFDVPEDRVAMFSVELQLTPAEACLPKAQLADALRTTLVDYLSEAASSFHTVQLMAMEVDMGDEQCASARRTLRKLLAGYSSASAAVKMLIVFKEGTVSAFNQAEFASMPGVASVEPDARNSPKIAIVTELACEEAGDCGMHRDPPSEKKSATNTAMIAGVAGGVSGGLLLAGGALLYLRSKRGLVTETAQPVQTISIEDLKSQLASDL